MYYFADEAKRDYPKAAYWYLKAAKQNKPEAQYMIGLMYYFLEVSNRIINKHDTGIRSPLNKVMFMHSLI